MQKKVRSFFHKTHPLQKKLGLELETEFRKNLDILRQNERTGTESDSPQLGKSCLSRQWENQADLAAKPESKGTIPTRPSETCSLRKFVKKWEEITPDPFIRNMVCGADIPIDEISDLQSKNQTYLKNQVQGNLRKETDTEILLSMGVIEKSMHQRDEIISPVFMVLKPDGSYRLILNLKKFNDSVQCEHFKMDNLTSATQMMTRGCYMASVDLRHAYYSVPIKAEYRKYLKFKWKKQLYQYTCLPNGLSNCPHHFTKLMKPVYATLRSQGYLSTSFIDDSYLHGNTLEECTENVAKTVELLDSLGFILHKEKSVLKPCKELKYFGFVLNSEARHRSLCITFKV